MPPRSCRVCAEGELQERPAVHGLALARCSSCGVICQEPEPDVHALLGTFQDSYFQGGHGHGYRDYLALEAAARRQARRYLATLARLDPGGRTLLDVGCAAGFLLAEAEVAGWQVSGIEPSPGMAQEARRRITGDVTVGDLAALPADTAPLHAVTMLNVLEHLARPADVAVRLAQLVRPGGILLMETFLTTQREEGWGPTSDAHLLLPGELARLVAPFEILHGREVAEPVDDGSWRLIASVVARRRT